MRPYIRIFGSTASARREVAFNSLGGAGYTRNSCIPNLANPTVDETYIAWGGGYKFKLDAAN